MKLKKLHLFLIIIGVLLLGSLGFTVKEGFDTLQDRVEEAEEKAYKDWNSSKNDDNSYNDNSYDNGDDNSYDSNDYVLKSSIVPPICPKCPQRKACPRQKPCPACPRPKRCPEPAFECKKVPNYSASRDPSNLPLPMLNSFSQF